MPESSPADPAADERAAVAAVSLAWKHAYNARDLDAVLALYTDHAVLSIPSQPVVRGKTQIEQMFAARIAKADDAGFSVQDVPLGEVVVSGDMAWQWQTFTMLDRAGTVLASGVLVTLFQKQHGRWLIAGDISNFEHPAVNIYAN